jgi:hypothetical protein
MNAVFTINHGEKFGVMALYHAVRAQNLPTETYVGDHIWILARTPIQIGDPWAKWLGSIRCEEIEEANLFVVTTMRSSDLETSNQENVQLSNLVAHYFLSLFLVGGFIYESASSVTGSNVSGMPEVRQFGPIERYFPSYDAYDFLVGPNELQTAKRVMDGVLEIYADNSLIRVRRGMRVFWRGLQERNPEDRLHQFVRSLDAIVMSRDGDQFGQRAKIFAAGADVEGILRQSYTLRSMNEHLHGWEPIIQRVYNPEAANAQGDEAQVEQDLLRRVRQLESLARHVYARIATSLPHRDAFRNNTIQAFWNLLEGEQRKHWDQPLNVDAIT